MSWITFLQIVALIFEVGVVVMVVMNFWRNVKEEAFNKKLAALGKTLEVLGKKIEESAKNKAEANKTVIELLKNAAKQDPPQT